MLLGKYRVDIVDMPLHVHATFLICCYFKKLKVKEQTVSLKQKL